MLPMHWGTAQKLWIAIHPLFSLISAMVTLSTAQFALFHFNHTLVTVTLRGTQEGLSIT